MMNDKKTVYIETIGCQMNVYDSEQMILNLGLVGYQKTNDIEKADLIITNTCSIRAKAEQKAFSFLGRLAKLKKKKQGLIVGIGGCVAQQEGRGIFKRAPYVDLVFGTQAIGRLPQLIEKIKTQNCRVVDINLTDQILPASININTPLKEVCRFVTIMRGCDNYCTYCVVPHVRGREISRTPDEIINEIECLVEKGVREVTLLGQNVNSYGIKGNTTTFPALLEKINGISDLLRIRFTTSHPKDLSEALVNAFQKVDKLCHHIHLPVQSGSNKILSKMNRRYTVEQYLERVENLRNACHDIAITSDFIVGFPGETDADFQGTLSLMEKVEFDGVFAFQYSDRPNAPARQFKEKIEESIKKERVNELLKVQKYYSKKKNKTLENTVQSILVEGMSKKQDEKSGQNCSKNQWAGRTGTNKIVNFEASLTNIEQTEIMGKIIPIKIEAAFSHSLKGTLLMDQIAHLNLKGDKSYAA